MLSIIHWSLLIVFSSLLKTGDGVDAHVSKAYYDIIKNEKVIGYMLCSKLANNETVEYINESSAHFSILIDISVYSKLHSSFNNGILRDGKLLRVVNGKTKAEKSIAWNNDKYLINSDGKSSTLQSKINFTTACLMYVEPQGIQNIFSENFGSYINIKAIAAHKYEFKLPDGSNNTYTYYEGKCTEVKVETAYADIYIKPRN